MDAKAPKLSDFECIPRDLKAIQRWVCWKFVRRGDGTLGKVPQGQYGNADAHSRKNWLTFEDAIALLHKKTTEGAWPHGGGIGFVFTEGDDIGGVDLDGCRDPETGQIASWAKRVLALFDGAYVEVSPSGTGFHIITRGAPEKLARTQRAVPPEVLAGDLTVEGKDAFVEAYVNKRYFTMTGEHATGRFELRDCASAWIQVAAYLRGDEPREDREAVARAAGQDFRPLGDGDLDTVRSALAAFSSDDVDRNTFVAIGMILKKEFGDAGRPVWLEWMARSPKDVAAETEKMWDGLPEAKLAGVGTIFYHAKEKGWKPPRKKDGGDGGGDTVATVLNGIISRAELWRDKRGEAYATVSVATGDGPAHRENMAVEGSAFSAWLTREFYLATGSSPKREKLKEVIATAAAQGMFSGQMHETWVRTAAGPHGKLYLDLGDEEWRAVEIDKDGWRVVSDPPVKFRRSGGGLPLPLPAEGNPAVGIALLGELIRPQQPEHLKLLIGALVSYLRPGYPFVGLQFDARPGSAKTSSLRIVESLVDPQSAETPGPPGNEGDLITAAQGQWLVRFDNVSSISASMSDAYCRLLTGGGSVKRKLYKDEERHSISVKRPLCMTLIKVRLRSDLAERSIVIPLAKIGEADRLPEEELNRRLTDARPIILGALLTGASKALERLEETKKRFIGKLPRMADFALFAEAAGEAFGWKDGEFIDAYRATIRARRIDDAEDDDFCMALFDWLCDRKGCEAEGKAGVLRQAMFAHASFNNAPNWFPPSPNAFAGAITRNEEMLEALGVEHEEFPDPRSRTAGRVHRLWLNEQGMQRRDERRSELDRMGLRWCDDEDDD